MAAHTIFRLSRRCDVSTATTGLQEHIQRHQAICFKSMAQSSVDWWLVDSVWTTPQNVNGFSPVNATTSLFLITSPHARQSIHSSCNLYQLEYHKLSLRRTITKLTKSKTCCQWDPSKMCVSVLVAPFRAGRPVGVPRLRCTVKPVSSDFEHLESLAQVLRYCMFERII